MVVQEVLEFFKVSNELNEGSSLLLTTWGWPRGLSASSGGICTLGGGPQRIRWQKLALAVLIVFKSYLTIACV